RQDRKIAFSSDRSVASPRPTRSSTARQIGNSAEPDCRMICAEPRATLAVELFAQRPGRVIPFIALAPLQLRHDQTNEIGETLRHHRVGEVEPVHIGVLDPGDQFFCNLCGRADHYRPTTADSGVLRDFPHRPYPVRIGKSEGFERPLMNAHSAWVAANWCPREDAPA